MSEETPKAPAPVVVVKDHPEGGRMLYLLETTLQNGGKVALDIYHDEDEHLCFMLTRNYGEGEMYNASSGLTSELPAFIALLSKAQEIVSDTAALNAHIEQHVNGQFDFLFKPSKGYVTTIEDMETGAITIIPSFTPFSEPVPYTFALFLNPMFTPVGCAVCREVIEGRDVEIVEVESKSPLCPECERSYASELMPLRDVIAKYRLRVSEDFDKAVIQLIESGEVYTLAPEQLDQRLTSIADSTDAARVIKKILPFNFGNFADTGTDTQQ